MGVPELEEAKRKRWEEFDDLESDNESDMGSHRDGDAE